MKRIGNLEPTVASKIAAITSKTETVGRKEPAIRINDRARSNLTAPKIQLGLARTRACAHRLSTSTPVRSFFHFLSLAHITHLLERSILDLRYLSGSLFTRRQSEFSALPLIILFALDARTPVWFELRVCNRPAGTRPGL